jgi:hypothetical protein
VSVLLPPLQYQCTHVKIAVVELITSPFCLQFLPCQQTLDLRSGYVAPDLVRSDRLPLGKD